MNQQARHSFTSNTIASPLRGVDLVSTFTAARILFPNEQITKSHLRLVQRLCQLNQLEAYKIGRKYRIVKQSIYDYLEENHYRNATATSSNWASRATQAAAI